VDEFAKRIRDGKQQDDDEEDSEANAAGFVESLENETHIQAQTPAPAEHGQTNGDSGNKQPTIVSQAGSIQNFNVGEPFVLVCQAKSGDDSPVSYTWTRNGHVLRLNDPSNQIYSESSSNGNLLFISPKLRDVGTYQCAAENVHGKTFSHATLLMVRKKHVVQEEGLLQQGVDEEAREPRVNDDGVFVVLPQSAPHVQVIDMSTTGPANISAVAAAPANTTTTTVPANISAAAPVNTTTTTVPADISVAAPANTTTTVPAGIPASSAANVTTAVLA
jgi:hypothetical protein